MSYMMKCDLTSGYKSAGGTELDLVDKAAPSQPVERGELPGLDVSSKRKGFGVYAVEKKYGINWNAFVYPLFQIGEQQGQMVCDLATALDQIDQRERQLLAALEELSRLKQREGNVTWRVEREGQAGMVSVDGSSREDEARSYYADLLSRQDELKFSGTIRLVRITTTEEVIEEREREG